MRFQFKKNPTDDTTANPVAHLRKGRGAHSVGLLMLLAAPAPVLSGCYTAYDPQTYAEEVARYLTKPLPKALYINTIDFVMYPRWGGSDVHDMVVLAEHDCRESSAKRGSPPGRCAPFYFNESRLIDPALYE